MQDRAIRSLSLIPSKHHEETFEESLYRHLRAAPWWLASTGIHAAAFLVLSVLVGSGGAERALGQTLQGEVAAPEVVLDEEPLPPEVDPTPPVDEDEKVKEVVAIDESRREDEAETDPSMVEEEDRFEDPRPDRGLFEGSGDNLLAGIGGNASRFGSGRGSGHRNLKWIAGDDRWEPSMDAGLRWLRRHQGRDGAWDGDGFEANCTGNRCGGAGAALYDPGLTGVSLLAFLGAGETHKSEKHGTVVRSGLRYLMGIQDAEGCFGPRTSSHFTYNHAIAALAMTEAYGLTGSPLFRAKAQAGIDFVTQCQNPYLAWRYGVKPQDNDTSVTGWMVMALKSAVVAGLAVDPGSFDGARAWLDRVTEPEYGRAGYTARGNGPARPQELMDRFPADRSESLTAVAVLTRIFCGAKEGDEMVRKGADLLLQCLPVFDEAAGTVDHYYWYYGSLAMFQVGGRHWDAWRKAMAPAILETQRRDAADCRYGSWDPVDPWGPEGGRVYSTALNTMDLQVYFRYEKVFGAK